MCTQGNKSGQLEKEKIKQTFKRAFADVSILWKYKVLTHLVNDSLKMRVLAVT